MGLGDLRRKGLNFATIPGTSGRNSNGQEIAMAEVMEIAFVILLSSLRKES